RGPVKTFQLDDVQRGQPAQGGIEKRGIGTDTLTRTAFLHQGNQLAIIDRLLEEIHYPKGLGLGSIFRQWHSRHEGYCRLRTLHRDIKNEINSRAIRQVNVQNEEMDSILL